MRRVTLRPGSAEQNAAFELWLTGPAAAARAAVCEATTDGQRAMLINQYKSVYQSRRDYLLWLFHDKCAYCEIDFRSATVQVEHFRPKAKVTGADNHPGYYWLMFEPSNLLPSCSRCNNRKRNKFPIAGMRALNADSDLSAEQPDLLNPIEDEALDMHIAVVADKSDPLLFGYVKSINNSSRGCTSIEIYGLNDDEKVRARQLEMRAFLREYKDAYEDEVRRKELLNRVVDGSRQCSLACLAMLNEWINTLRREVESQLIQGTSGISPAASVPDHERTDDSQ